MKTEARQMWVDALRSGEYSQTEGELQYRGEYCCLGVAAHIFGKAGNSVRIDPDGSLSGGCLLDQPGAKDWLGLRTSDGNIPLSAISGKQMNRFFF